MPNNMNNMGMPNSSQNSMVPNRPPMGMPSSSGENITVQDPFADNVQMTNSNQFSRPGGPGSQLPPYNAGGIQQQQQQNMPNSGGYFNRQNVGNSMGYNSQQQQGMNNQQQGPYNSGMVPGVTPGNDPYRRGMGSGIMQQQQPGQQQPNQQQGPQPDGFNNQFNNRQNSMGPGGVAGNSQFPFGASAER